MAGMAPLFVFFAVGIKPLKISNEIISAVTIDPLSNIWAFLIIFACMVLASVLIYVFNYRITFKKTIQEKALRAKMSLILAIVTTPWTFLLPIEWFYKKPF